MMQLVIVASLLAVASAGSKRFGIQTRAVHAGSEAELNGFTVVPPISLSTTFVQPFPGVRPGKDDPNSHGAGYYYARNANPTRGALERAIAEVEGGKHCTTFSSGLAATAACVSLVKSGGEIIALDDLFGGTSSYFRECAEPDNGVKFTFMNLDDIAKVEAAITPRAKMIWLESPTNPLLKTTDIRAISALCKRKGLILVVDSTFMSPYLQHPLELGADVVVHSVTKFIAGHSDVVMGAAITNNDDINKKLRNTQALNGAVPSPFDCYLAMRGLKTLPLRMEAAQKNAMKCAQFLETHPVVQSVVYPGLRSYKQYDLAKSQTDGPGAMISVHIKGGLKVAGKFLQELKIFGLAVSLGAIHSLACSPALMTHATVPVEAREAIGLTDSLIRIAVGVEDAEDLVADLKQALDKAQLELPNAEFGAKK